MHMASFLSTPAWRPTWDIRPQGAQRCLPEVPQSLPMAIGAAQLCAVVQPTGPACVGLLTAQCHVGTAE